MGRTDSIFTAVTVFWRQSESVILEDTKIPYKSLRLLQRELDTEDFLQCSRTTVVNKEFIKTVDVANRFIYLYECEDVLEIGPVMKKSFLKAIGFGRNR